MQKAEIAGLHGGGEAGGDGLLAERQVAGAFDEILQEQIVGALLGLADLDLHAIHGEPLVLADVVIEACLRAGARSSILAMKYPLDCPQMLRGARAT